MPVQGKAFAEGGESVKNITIVHVNDVHGRIKEGDYDGMGFARMATKISELKEENPNLILLNAGGYNPWFANSNNIPGGNYDKAYE